MLPKKTPNQPLKRSAERSNIGTGLSSTLLSSQRTTTHQKPDPHQKGPVLGATRTTLPARPRTVKPRKPARNRRTRDRTAPGNNHDKHRDQIPKDSARTAAAEPRRTPPTRPSPRRLDQHYRLATAAPNPTPYPD